MAKGGAKLMQRSQQIPGCSSSPLLCHGLALLTLLLTSDLCARHRESDFPWALPLGPSLGVQGGNDHILLWGPTKALRKRGVELTPFLPSTVPPAHRAEHSAPWWPPWQCEDPKTVEPIPCSQLPGPSPPGLSPYSEPRGLMASYTRGPYTGMSDST